VTASPQAIPRAVGPMPLPGVSETGHSALIGRDTIVDRALRTVSLGGNVLLFGADGSGRTALLHEIARRLALGGQPVDLVDGSRVHDAARLLNLVLRVRGATVAGTDDIPAMLVDLGSVALAPAHVVCLDDMEVETAQELFGRWRRHLWRLGISWVVVGGAEDPTPYLDAGADAWWEDGVLPVPPLDREEARELAAQRLQEAGFQGECPGELIEGARGNPRDLVRRVRSFLLTQAEAGTGLRGSADPLARWTGRASVTLPDELSADEARLAALVRSSGPFSLADRTVPAELGWAYGKVHRVANELVRRGVLTRTEAPGEIGRPRVVYSLTVA